MKKVIALLLLSGVMSSLLVAQSLQFIDCPNNALQNICATDTFATIPQNDSTCFGLHILQSQTISGICEGNITYSVRLFKNNNSAYVTIVEDNTVTNDSNGVVISFDSQLSPNANVSTFGIPYNGTNCEDIHRIVWIAEDECGNGVTCEYFIKLLDCQPPEVVCTPGIDTFVTPVSGVFTIWAQDFVLHMRDNCLSEELILFSFSDTSYIPFLDIDCCTVPAFGAVFEHQIFAGDGGHDMNCNDTIEWNERNLSACTKQLIVHDFEGSCSDACNYFVMNGNVVTFSGSGIPDATVTFGSSEIFPKTTTTDDNGQYSFFVPSNDSVQISVSKEDDHRNGLSTLDLIRIQKHLLSLQPFDHAWEYLASDANRNRGVSALDLVELRKLILGIYNELPNQDSWVFVTQESYVDSFDTFEEIALFEYNYFTKPQVTQYDFFGIKIGDLNNSITSPIQMETPADNNFRMVIKDTLVKEGDYVDISIKIRSNQNLEYSNRFYADGFQGTFGFTGLQFQNINSGTLPISKDHFGTLGEYLSFSWNDSFDFEQNKDETLFTISFKALRNGLLSEMISLNDHVATSEIYFSNELDEVNNSYHIKPLQLQFESKGSQTKPIQIFQNFPNPTKDFTSIPFYIEKEGVVSAQIIDANGQIVWDDRKKFFSGNNHLTIPNIGHLSSGVYFYKLSLNGFSAIQKMIVVD